MNILDIAKQRFSVRNYLTKEISQETLETILEAAHVAPTAANMQPVKLLVVKSDEAKEKLAKAANIYSAPVAIIVCAAMEPLIIIVMAVIVVPIVLAIMMPMYSLYDSIGA